MIPWGVRAGLGPCLPGSVRRCVCERPRRRVPSAEATASAFARAATRRCMQFVLCKKVRISNFKSGKADRSQRNFSNHRTRDQTGDTHTRERSTKSDAKERDGHTRDKRTGSGGRVSVQAKRARDKRNSERCMQFVLICTQKARISNFNCNCNCKQ